MKLRSNKGVTGVDLSIALIIIVLFVGLVSTLSYNYVKTSRSVNRKAIATDIAIRKIEELKQTPYDDILEIAPDAPEGIQYADKEGTILSSGTGPYQIITEIRKYSNTDIENLQDVMKIVTVKVIYNYKATNSNNNSNSNSNTSNYNNSISGIENSEKSVEISTVITKGD